ncbi:MAG: SDR family oxidoreductase [Fuerstiella sp.]
MVNSTNASSHSDANWAPVDGSVAVVTGAAKRIGRQIALALAQQLKLNVVVHCGNSVDAANAVATEIQDYGCRSVVVSADLNQSEAAAARIFAAAQRLGVVRVLINCAAVFDDKRLLDVSSAHCAEHFAVNTVAPIFLTQQLVRQLPAGETAHIVNMLDWRAQRATATHVVYSATKTALASVTKGLAQQLGPHVQVNGIAPGAILPPDERPNWHTDRAVESIPLKRAGKPSDICDAVVFLLRSSFITGEILHVSGGEEL